MIDFLIPTILILFILLIIKSIPYNEEKCTDGKKHLYTIISEKYVRGNDIGFGITNSYTKIEYECRKCKKLIKTIK